MAEGATLEVVVLLVTPGVVVLVAVVELVELLEDAPHIPKAGLHPAPHHAVPLPQYQYSEQHSPPAKPAHVVELPHIPFGETVKVPDGAGLEVVDEEVVVTLDVVEEEEEVEELDEEPGVPHDP